MNEAEHYREDVLFFFDGRPLELAVYEAFFHRMEAAFPEASVKVQKSQISFYSRRLFTAASLPLRRKKDWPAHCLLVTFGLERRLESPRIAVAVEPYPNRWTHHVLVEEERQLDGELMGWLGEAYEFSEAKRGGGETGRRRNGAEAKRGGGETGRRRNGAEAKRMNAYTTEELLEAKRSIASTLGKCEKALGKLTPGKSQHTLTARRIQAFRISLALIDRALEENGEAAQ